MIIDCVLTSSNINNLYLHFIPTFIKSWQKLLPHIDVKIILISDNIPDEYKSYENNIILFKPIENVSDVFISQYIRILYPSILKYKNGVLITDIDMLPINEKYFTDTIKEYSENKFINYRDFLTNCQYPICYNIATPLIWKKINNMENIDNIIEHIKSKKNILWDTDQRYLHYLITKYNNTTKNAILLKDENTHFKRLNRCTFKKDFNIIKNKIYKKIYCDYHAERPNIGDNFKLNNKIIDLIPKYKKDIILLVIASRSDFYDKLILNHWIRYIKYAESNYKNVKIYLIFGKNKFGKNTNIDLFNVIKENILLLDEEDNLIPGIFNKTIKAFEKINLSYDYNYIFRTNLSSFIRIDLLLEKTKDINDIYGFIGNYNGINFISGAGMLLTKKNIEYIQTNQNKINKNLPDDVALSSIFNIKNISVENNKILRYDFLNNDLNIDFKKLNKYYHFRIKNKNRDSDLIIFDKLYHYFFK